MVGLQGIQSVPVRANTTEAAPFRARKDAVKPGEQVDRVAISEQARSASEISKFVEAAKTERDAISEERVARAKENIEEGTYRLQEVILTVAARLGAQLDM